MKEIIVKMVLEGMFTWDFHGALAVLEVMTVEYVKVVL